MSYYAFRATWFFGSLDHQIQGMRVTGNGILAKSVEVLFDSSLMSLVWNYNQPYTELHITKTPEIFINKTHTCKFTFWRKKIREITSLHSWVSISRIWFSIKYPLSNILHLVASNWSKQISAPAIQHQKPKLKPGWCHLSLANNKSVSKNKSNCSVIYTWTWCIRWQVTWSRPILTVTVGQYNPFLCLSMVQVLLMEMGHVLQEMLVRCLVLYVLFCKIGRIECTGGK